MVDVAEQEAARRLVDDQANVVIHADRPEVLVFRPCRACGSFRPGLDGLSCKSKAVVLTAVCSFPVSRARLSVNVSAMRNSMTLHLEHLHHLVAEMVDHLHGDPA